MEMSSLRPRTKASYHHNMKIIIIVTLVVTLCYPTLINTAMIRPEKLGEQLQRIVLRGSRNIRSPGATEDSNEENVPVLCQNTACGWAVYHPYTRNVEYFMKNTCNCPDESYKCVRSGDDLSASAYVYRCRQNTTAQDLESPNEA